MNCDMKPLVSEYVDGALTPDRRRRVETHLAQCADCARLAEDFRGLSHLLQGLPAAQTSAGFEGSLAERLAHARRPAPFAAWLRRMADALRPSPAVLRPALALGTAMVVTAGVVLHQPPPGPITLGPASPSVAVDKPLVSHCVEQHLNYVAVQPLSDIAAQNLATQLDATGSLTPEGDGL